MIEEPFKDLAIDYYHGAYGETLRCWTDERDDLKVLNAIFRGVPEDRVIDHAA